MLWAESGRTQRGHTVWLKSRDIRDNQEHGTKIRLLISGPSPENPVAKIYTIPIFQTDLFSKFVDWIKRLYLQNITNNYGLFTL